MSERPILFSGPMVRAILAGKKTQTRRIVNPQPPSPKRHLCGKHDVHCPFGAPGDRLWVRECFARENLGPEEYPRLVYRADLAARWFDPGNSSEIFYLESDYKPKCWTPSIYMPRCASRITLEVTDVRVERLQAITTEDIAAEGMPIDYSVPDHPWTLEHEQREAFRELWDSLNAKRGYGWERNPLVWTLTFRRVA